MIRFPLAASLALGACAFLMAPAAAQAPAPAWTVVPAQSRLGFATTWAGQAVNGTFGQWSADIRFDPRNLAGSRAVVLVQTGSVRTGLAEPDQNLPMPDFFHVERFPTARWESTSIRATGPGRYLAEGTLTLKGRPYRLALPFSLAITDTTATMSGTMTLNRQALNVGMESDSSFEWVPRDFTLQVQVRATRR
jgi:cytochrome b561